MKCLLTLLLVVFFGVEGSSQVNFNDYTTLLSSGPIPDDFTRATYQKRDAAIANSIEDLSTSDKKVFYTNINYTVDALLHSGSVVYGDPLSEYVESIAKKLLIRDKQLFRELRFYTIKSNSSNAFSTDQGILFVTTGLIAQVANEAQLAYILAHEIAHYKEKHVLNAYNYKRANRSASMEQMSVYSKEHEFEADKIGLEMYARAGYARQEVLPTFDVLLYSYLPFDEIEVPDNYLIDFDSLYVPKELFPETPYPIEAIEDEDDSKSSHPNIKSRKEAVQGELDGIRNWKNDLYKLGEARFKEIRTIARFEVVRSCMHTADYGEAIYTLFLLEQEFPSSLFIQRMKAQAWLGILQYRLDNSLFSVVESKSKLEGASGKVHHFIKEMSKHQLITMCIRQVTEVYRENTADSHVKAVFEKMIEAISYEKRFELEDYFEISFQTAYSQHFQNSSASHTHELPDSSDFHLYLIPDLKRDTSFLRLYNFYHQSYLEEQRDKSAYSRMSAKERYYYDQKKKHRKGFSDGMKSEQLICMEPIVLQYGRKGLRQVKSEKTKETFRETIDLAARQARIFVFHLDRKTTEDEGTQAYNDRCVLVNYLEQSANNSDLVSFPVDYSLVHQVKEKFGTPYVLYSVAKHGYYPDVLTPGTLYALLFFPAAPVYFPIKFFSGNQSEINMIVLDLETGKVEGMMSHKFKSTLRKHVFGAHIYSLFDTLNPN